MAFNMRLFSIGAAALLSVLSGCGGKDEGFGNRNGGGEGGDAGAGGDAQGGDAGAGGEEPCSGNQRRCNQNRIEVCDATGHWAPERDCSPDGLVCNPRFSDFGPRCVEPSCEDGESRCNGEVVERCQ